MEAKKNPKKDLNKSSGVFFAAGMVMVLALTYVALEWKTFYGKEYDVSENIILELVEEVPIIRLEPPPPPPPPPVAPKEIKVVEDDDPIIESFIDLPEPNQATEVAILEDLDFQIVPEEVDVPFILVEDAPVFPGCENASNKRACFNTKMLRHIKKTFRYPEIAQEMGIQGKVHMHFIIQKDGNIGNVQIVRSPDKNLGAEATRIINKLPKMIPGKQRGNAVRVPFSIPITFELQ
ncbi:energy transducer TonB [Maribacter algarum]|uniref:Energy transducer TonB n=1 Tax=Maribacter algarum (ex Zhang et al. 2020) TaxID=2578118 RepID=A0A5S3PUA5_9FLAO|nr:energy transducer TonB [Maribacter algarum]TMM56270.1 energy transducer TonB [Maribacter algarum]